MSNAVERDCNTCKHHIQGQPVAEQSWRCWECKLPAGKTTLAEGRLPFWEPITVFKEVPLKKPAPTPCQDGTCYCDLSGEGEPQVRPLLMELDPTHTRVISPGKPGAVIPVPAGVNPAHAVMVMPTDAAARKEIPLATGCIDYFPAALAEVAKLSKKGNDQHNPGQPLHWARGKSMDHPDTVMRHFVDRGLFDSDGVRHSAKLAWRALALLQEELEAAGAPMARGAK